MRITGGMLLVTGPQKGICLMWLSHLWNGWLIKAHHLPSLMSQWRHTGSHLLLPTYALAAQAEHASLHLCQVGNVHSLSSFRNNVNDGQVWSCHGAPTCASGQERWTFVCLSQRSLLLDGAVCAPAAESSPFAVLPPFPPAPALYKAAGEMGLGARVRVSWLC